MSETEPAKKSKGAVFVQTEVCKGCAYCIEFCPGHGLEFSKEFNSKGYHYPVLAKPEACTGCDLCGLFCPDFAIFAVRLKDQDQRPQAESNKGPLLPAKE